MPFDDLAFATWLAITPLEPIQWVVPLIFEHGSFSFWHVDEFWSEAGILRPVCLRCLAVRCEQLTMYVESNHPLTFDEALHKYASAVHLSPRYFLINFHDMHELAILIRHLPLTTEERYTFATSPCDPSDCTVGAAFLNFATIYAMKGVVNVTAIRHPTVGTPRTEVGKGTNG